MTNQSRRLQVLLILIFSLTLALNAWAGGGKRTPKAKPVSAPAAGIVPRSPAPPAGNLFVAHAIYAADVPGWHGFVEVVNPQSLIVERTVEWEWPVSNIVVAADNRSVYGFSNQACYLGEFTLPVQGEVQTLTHYPDWCLSEELPRAAVFSPDQQFVYFATSNSGLYRFDRTAGRVTGSNPGLQRNNIAYLAISPDGSVLAMTNQTTAVTLFDANTLARIATIPLSGGGVPLVFNSTGTEIYIFASRSPQGAIDVIDMASRTRVASITLPIFGSNAKKIAISHDNRTLFVVGEQPNAQIYWGNTQQNDIGIVGLTIDLATRQISRQVGLPHDPMGLTVSPDDQTLYLIRYGFGGAPGLMVYNPDLTPRLTSDLNLRPEAQVFADITFAVPLQTAPPACSGDFNYDGVASQQDIYDFLAAYHANDPSADFNRNGSVSVQDLFDFLAAYNQGCH